jgi:small subunit ribosomal protein S8
MSQNDPIADLLTRLRNGKEAKLLFVDIPLSKVKVKILEILKKQGFIENFLISQEKKKMRIFLRYNKARNSVINDLRRMSSPGFRKYIEYKKIPRIANGMGIAILSTSRGIMDGDTAKKERIGGEFLCKVW